MTVFCAVHKATLIVLHQKDGNVKLYLLKCCSQETCRVLGLTHVGRGKIGQLSKS